MRGLEPPTSGSTDRRSNQLSYIHRKSILYYINFCSFTQRHLRKKGSSSSFLPSFQVNFFRVKTVYFIFFFVRVSQGNYIERKYMFGQIYHF